MTKVSSGESHNYKYKNIQTPNTCNCRQTNCNGINTFAKSPFDSDETRLISEQSTKSTFTHFAKKATGAFMAVANPHIHPFYCCNLSIVLSMYPTHFARFLNSKGGHFSGGRREREIYSLSHRAQLPTLWSAIPTAFFPGINSLHYCTAN